MTRFLYPLVASALITIVPFLITFEKGQDIVRGLFGYEEFAILLFFVFFKNKLLQNAQRNLFKILWITILALLVGVLFAIAWIDLQNLLAIKGSTTGWHILLPLITCAIAIAIVWKTRPFRFNTICFILFISLMVHLFALNHYAEQPLAQFPTIEFLSRNAVHPVQRTEISNEYRSNYTITDSVTITRDYIDTSRNNIIILVESWGVPLDTRRFEKQLNIFKGITTAKGIHNRMYSRTRTAEREDLMLYIKKDSLGHRDTTFLPHVFASMGYKTSFLFGGDSLEHQRNKYIKNIGFVETTYGSGLEDATMATKINSLLVDTTQKHFIAWTTRDTKFPIKNFPDIYSCNANMLDSAYSYHLEQTLLLIADLARKHPETRFIIQGDHNPILSPVEFQEKFYKRWVPFIVLN